MADNRYPGITPNMNTREMRTAIVGTTSAENTTKSGAWVLVGLGIVLFLATLVAIVGG
jgi:hypothetical protein